MTKKSEGRTSKEIKMRRVRETQTLRRPTEEDQPEATEVEVEENSMASSEDVVNSEVVEHPGETLEETIGAEAEVKDLSEEEEELTATTEISMFILRQRTKRSAMDQSPLPKLRSPISMIESQRTRKGLLGLSALHKLRRK